MLISGGNIEIVSYPKRDWQALERKMGSGLSLAEAADQCGIPQPEADKWATDRAEHGAESSSQMRAVATNALKIAIEKLQAIVVEGPRFSSTEYSDETGKPIKSVTPLSTDLEAAKALASLAVNAMKLAGAGKTASDPTKTAKLSVQLDLWDAPGNWELKKPG